MKDHEQEYKKMFTEKIDKFKITDEKKSELLSEYMSHTYSSAMENEYRTIFDNDKKQLLIDYGVEEPVKIDVPQHINNKEEALFYAAENNIDYDKINDKFFKQMFNEEVTKLTDEFNDNPTFKKEVMSAHNFDDFDLLLDVRQNHFKEQVIYALAHNEVNKAQNKPYLESNAEVYKETSKYMTENYEKMLKDDYNAMAPEEQKAAKAHSSKEQQEVPKQTNSIKQLFAKTLKIVRDKKSESQGEKLKTTNKIKM